MIRALASAGPTRHRARATAVGRGSLAGALAAACFVAGDVLLLGRRPDPIAHPILNRDDIDLDAGVMLQMSPRRLLAGALLGVVASPGYLVGNRDLHRAMLGGGASPGRARVAVTALACCHVLSPHIHGMFYPLALAYRRADESLRDGADPATVEAHVAHARRLRLAIEIPYVAYAAAMLTGSAVLAGEIARGRTLYPAWSAPLVPPALPIVALTALTATGVNPHERSRVALQGSGVSVGILVSFVAGAVLRRAPGPAHGPSSSSISSPSS